MERAREAVKPEAKQGTTPPHPTPPHSAQQSNKNEALK